IPGAQADWEYGPPQDRRFCLAPPESSQPLRGFLRSIPRLFRRDRRVIGAPQRTRGVLDTVGGPTRGHVRHAERLDRRPGRLLAGALRLRRPDRELSNLDLVGPEVTGELLDGWLQRALAPRDLRADVLTRRAPGQH